MNDDLSRLLRDWPYEPGRINARKLMGNDGREKLQMRVDLGILQMELHGRPDGARPHGFDSLLDYQRDRLDRYIRVNGTAAGFTLGPEECSALREEAVHFYHRYVGLFAMRDFGGVIRDASHNLDVLDLCGEFGATETDRTVLEQFRPQLITMRGRSEAESALAVGKPREALAALDRSLAELRTVFEDAGAEGAFDQANEVQLLRGMRDVLVPKLPSSQKAELQERLMAAIDAENYELAAILRDELRML